MGLFSKNDNPNSKSYNGAQPYDGTQRGVEPKGNHSASYSGKYASKGKYAEQVKGKRS